MLIDQMNLFKKIHTFILDKIEKLTLLYYFYAFCSPITNRNGQNIDIINDYI